MKLVNNEKEFQESRATKIMLFADIDQISDLRDNKIRPDDATAVVKKVLSYWDSQVGKKDEEIVLIDKAWYKESYYFDIAVEGDMVYLPSKIGIFLKDYFNVTDAKDSIIKKIKRKYFENIKKITDDLLSSLDYFVYRTEQRVIPCDITHYGKKFSTFKLLPEAVERFAKMIFDIEKVLVSGGKIVCDQKGRLYQYFSKLGEKDERYSYFMNVWNGEYQPWEKCPFALYVKREDPRSNMEFLEQYILPCTKEIKVQVEVGDYKNVENIFTTARQKPFRFGKEDCYAADFTPPDKEETKSVFDAIKPLTKYANDAYQVSKDPVACKEELDKYIKTIVGDNKGEEVLMLTKEEIYPALEKLNTFTKRLDNHKEHILNLCKKHKLFSNLKIDDFAGFEEQELKKLFTVEKVKNLYEDWEIKNLFTPQEVKLMFSVKEIRDLLKDEKEWIEMEEIKTEKKKSNNIEDELSTKKKEDVENDSFDANDIIKMSLSKGSAEEFENNNIEVQEFEEK